MYKIIAIFVFFVSFYRISLFNHNLYISLFFGFLGLIMLLLSKNIEFLLRTAGGVVTLILGLLTLFAFTLDVAGSLQLGNIGNSFFVRIMAFFLLSVFPAYFLYSFYIKKNKEKLMEVIFISFFVQFLFWFLTYLIPEMKIYVYSLMGLANSVNLYDYNMGARGFGFSKEINYTTPYMMVLVSLLLVKKNILSIVTLPTQLVNSNMVVIASFIGLFSSKIKLYYKFLLIFLILIMILLLGEVVFSRLYAELALGGMRTIDILLDRHVFALNGNLFEHFFGTGQYVFQGGAERSSDVGWVIMYNYGGMLFVVLFFLYLITASFSIFGKNFSALAWLASGIILNTKGLLLGPNAYFFMTVLLSFFSYKNKTIKW